MVALNFNKKIVVGVSINPEVGLEAAVVDYPTKKILKYGVKPLAYDNIRKEITDMDIFNETLRDLLYDLQIPKGSEVVVNLPPAVFGVIDFPASWDNLQVENSILEKLTSLPLFENNEPAITKVKLPNSTIQTSKYAYAAASKTMVTEIVILIKELGYSVIAVEVSPNASLNAIVYNDRVEVSDETNWVMLIVENNCCRILSMLGNVYVDAYEERISIGEVLGDEENYSTVVNAVNPILNNLPSQFLYVISKTNIISAKKLADNLFYNTQIVHQESNFYAASPFMEIEGDVDESVANLISIDVLGASIWRDFHPQVSSVLNLFNETLGDIYISEQPPVINIGTKKIILSMQNMIVASVFYLIIISIIILVTLLPINNIISQKNAEVQRLKKEIASIEEFLKKNDKVSSDVFDENDEIKLGLIKNKGIYSYYSIVGTEIPKKLWLTYLNLGDHITIEGQADNIESIYSFFRNVRDYNPNSKLKLQKLGLATASNLTTLSEEEAFDTDSIITSMNADFYEFRISNAPEIVKKEEKSNKNKKGTKVPNSELKE